MHETATVGGHSCIGWRGRTRFVNAQDERNLLMPFEELHSALVLFGCVAGLESSEITALACARILLSRVEPILAGFQLSDHAKPANAPRGYVQLSMQRDGVPRALSSLRP